MKSINLFFRVAAIAIYLLASIATCAAVWNSRPDAILSIFAGVTLASNCYAIYRWAKATEKQIKEKEGSN